MPDPNDKDAKMKPAKPASSPDDSDLVPIQPGRIDEGSNNFKTAALGRLPGRDSTNTPKSNDIIDAEMYDHTEYRTPVKAKPASSSNDSDWVRIQSRDGFTYLVRRNLANASGTLKTMLDDEGESGFAESLTGTCSLDERGIIVEKLVEYMAFKTYHEGPGSKEEVPLNEFMERIPPEIILELLLAADYQEM